MTAADIIRIENNEDSIARYEELLLRRDNLRKKAEQYQISYFKVFGDLLVESFRIRIECIRKKKIIAYCQQQINHGRKINGAQLDHYITREMEEYRDELDTMIRHNLAVKASEKISDYDELKVKKLYYALAKLIHPDLHPENQDDPRLIDYWNSIVLAYEHNMLTDLEELDFQVKKYIEDKGGKTSELVIPDLPQKIAKVEAEIERITSTDPYLYRLILEDIEAIDAKKDDLKEEIQTYKNYSEQLDEVISQFDIERNYS